MKRVLIIAVAAALGAVCVWGEWVYEGEWGSSGSGNGQFYTPAGVAAVSNGNVYVTDYGNDRVQYFTAAGSYLGKWGSIGTGDGQFHSATRPAVTPKGVVLVADYFNNRIQYFTLTGSFLGKFGSEGTGNGQFRNPVGIGFNRSASRIYVADHNNNRIQYFLDVAQVGVAPTSLGRVRALFK